MDDRYVSFRGQDGNEAEEFIQAVRRAAFDADKDRDDEWMARFASTCMSGKALRWHASLDDDVQESWKRLMKAILARYPPADEDVIVPSAPAAAPAAPAASRPSSLPQVDFAPPAAAPPQSYTPKPRSKPFDGTTGVISAPTTAAPAPSTTPNPTTGEPIKASLTDSELHQYHYTNLVTPQPGFAEGHAQRIAKETRKVVRIAAWDTRSRFCRAMDERGAEVKTAEEDIGRASTALKFFDSIEARTDAVRVKAELDVVA